MAAPHTERDGCTVALVGAVGEVLVVGAGAGAVSSCSSIPLPKLHQSPVAGRGAGFLSPRSNVRMPKQRF